MAFTAHERRDLGLDGLLPPVVETLEQQAQRGYEAPVRGELPGIWTGAGAAALGLAGEVDEDGIQRSLNAQNPRPDVEALARGAHMSAGHLNREFRSPTAGRRTPTG